MTPCCFRIQRCWCKHELLMEGTVDQQFVLADVAGSSPPPAPSAAEMWYKRGCDPLIPSPTAPCL